jgi:hypothetical protein
MTTAQLQARALTRAYEQHVHIFSVPGRPGVYVTRSKSEPRERYNLVVDGDIVACSCKGYEYRACCKHSEALRNRLAREAVAAGRHGGDEPPTAPAALARRPAAPRLIEARVA